ncbi:apolipoprotein N-acyltransferase, partial [Mycobacterium stomatepiae]|nr:apolipoprotein N-acyltransferase [Mycobacterium stomatepiae]
MAEFPGAPAAETTTEPTTEIPMVPMEDLTAPDPAGPTRLERFGVAAADRWAQLAASVGAGMLLRSSFPPLNWWWAAVLAFALLAWVLVRRETTVAGGFGYGLLCGLAFYVPLLPWVGGLVGAWPWLALALMCAL